MIKDFLLPLALTAAAAGPVSAEVPRVVADMPVIGALVGQVMGDLGQPEVLVPSGSDLHHYQLRPSQARSLQDAGLLVWVGPALTPWLEQPLTGLGRDVQSLTLLDLPGTRHRDFDAGHDADHDADGHDHGGHPTDPHAWLDPDNGRVWLAAIAAALSAQDPEHAATYAANAARAEAEITALDDELRARLTPLAGKPFVVPHDAYGYFTGHFGLAPALAVSAGDAASPSAARLQAIRDQIRASGASCAFAEANHDSRLLDAVTDGGDLRRGAELDPEGSNIAPGPDLYAATLRNMGNALADCLSD